MEVAELDALSPLAMDEQGVPNGQVFAGTHFAGTHFAATRLAALRLPGWSSREIWDRSRGHRRFRPISWRINGTFFGITPPVVEVPEVRDGNTFSLTNAIFAPN